MIEWMALRDLHGWSRGSGSVEGLVDIVARCPNDLGELLYASSRSPRESPLDQELDGWMAGWMASRAGRTLPSNLSVTDMKADEGLIARTRPASTSS